MPARIERPWKRLNALIAFKLFSALAGYTRFITNRKDSKKIKSTHDACCAVSLCQK